MQFGPGVLAPTLDHVVSLYVSGSVTRQVPEKKYYFSCVWWNKSVAWSISKSAKITW